MWRQALTNYLLKGYFSSLNYYKLSLSTATVDNPDQRISEDVINFTSRSVRFITIFAVAVFDLLVFSVILYRIYAPLLYTLFAYSAIGTAAISLAGRDLLSFARKRTEREGNFRFGLVRMRESTESVAFYGGEEAENAELQTRFASVFRNNIVLLALQRNVEFLSTAFRYFAQIVPTMVIAPRYFSGSVQLGVISQVFFSFNHVLSSLGLVVQEFRALSEYGAGTRRLKGLADALTSDTRASSTPTISTQVDENDSADRIALRSVSVITPGDQPRVLLQDVNVEIGSGERLLVIGVSGIGKSSLMRVISGLWDCGEGVVERPASRNTLFLPQKPFIMLGSLRENVIYPSSRADVTDDEVMDALHKVNIGYLPQAVGGLDTPGESLSRRLSLGEQQRLAFARIMIAKPQVVILDESSSALDLDNESDMYALIKSLGCTCVSVGNRPSLVDFHDQILRLEGEGKWALLTPDAVKKQRRKESV